MDSARAGFIPQPLSGTAGRSLSRRLWGPTLTAQGRIAEALAAGAGKADRKAIPVAAEAFRRASFRDTENREWEPGGGARCAGRSSWEVPASSRVATRSWSGRATSVRLSVERPPGRNAPVWVG